MSGTCKTCGKVINPKGEKGDRGAQGPAGTNGTNGTNGAGVMENYFNSTPQLVYNGGAGITIDFGTSNANTQRIYYQGTVAVRAIAAANFTATPDGTSVLTSEVTNHTLPAIAGGIAFTYATIPIAGDMLVDVSGTAFGIKLETAGAAEEVEFLSINVNFTRA